MSRKYSVILGNLGNTCDRFLSSGYKEPARARERPLQHLEELKGSRGKLGSSVEKTEERHGLQTRDPRRA